MVTRRGWRAAIRALCITRPARILNSDVLDFYLKRVSTRLQGGFYRYFTQFVGQLPVRRIDFTHPGDVRQHNQIVALAREALALHREQAMSTDLLLD